MFSAVTGLLLAGGQSSRMGQNKALLHWQGQPLYRHMLQLMRDAGLSRLELSGTLTEQSIPDRYPDQGPLGGIDACVAAGKAGDGLLIVPVDMPLLKPVILTELITAGSNAGIACCYENSSLPLFIPVDQPLEQALDFCFSSPHRRDRSIRMLLKQRGELLRLASCPEINTISESVPVTESVYFKNANTPAEWIECQSVVTASTVPEPTA